MNVLKCLLIVLIVLPFMNSCIAKYTVPEDGNFDSQFVGKWEGKHYNKEKRYWRKWTQIRNLDGTYKLVLKYYNQSDSFLDSEVQTGYWWVKDGMFYEIAPSRMSQPETYKYKFITAEKIEFTSIQLDSSSDEKESYSFIDTKVIE